MLRFEWFKAVKRPSPVVLWARRRGPRPPGVRRVPRLEALEGRALLSTTFTVKNLADSGTVSLHRPSSTLTPIPAPT